IEDKENLIRDGKTVLGSSCGEDNDQTFERRCQEFLSGEFCQNNPLCQQVANLGICTSIQDNQAPPVHELCDDIGFGDCHTATFCEKRNNFGVGENNQCWASTDRY